MSQFIGLLSFLFAIICAILAIIGIIKPNIAFFLKNTSRGKAFLSYILIGFLSLCVCTYFAITDKKTTNVQKQVATQNNIDESKEQVIKEKSSIETKKRDIIEKQSTKQDMEKEAKLPKYTIKQDHTIPKIKISFECMLDKPVDESTLIKLFDDIAKKYHTADYQNCFIIWMLPHYKPGHGAWATTHRTGRDFKVSILASQDYALEQEAKRKTMSIEDRLKDVDDYIFECEMDTKSQPTLRVSIELGKGDDSPIGFLYYLSTPVRHIVGYIDENHLLPENTSLQILVYLEADKGKQRPLLARLTYTNSDIRKHDWQKIMFEDVIDAASKIQATKLGKDVLAKEFKKNPDKSRGYMPTLKRWLSSK